MRREPAAGRARGKWHGLLPALGIPAKALSGKHGPCPACGGKDRFRFDDKEGKGTFICSHCGAGDGFKLLQLVHGWGFSEAARHVEELAGGIESKAIKAEMTDAEIRRRKRDLWCRSRPVARGDAVDAYLRSRGCGLDGYPGALRLAADADGTAMMLAMVSDANGKPATLHRTWLPNGRRGERKLMPGPVPRGGAVRLGPAAERIGVAEGIETALSASVLFGLSVWSAVNTTMMQQWQPPPETREVVVYGDNDPKLGGQAAAYGLAHRLACKGLAVSVEIAPAGDWNDILRGGIERAGRRQSIGAALPELKRGLG